MSKSINHSERRRRESIEKIATLAGRYIWSVTAVIALVFTALSFKDMPVEVISGANPEYVQAAVLSVYIWCWAAGTAVDTSTQKSVYLIDPTGGKFRMDSLVPVAALALISVLLLLVRRNEVLFAFALAAFTAADVGGWLYLRYFFLPPIITATRAEYTKHDDYYGLIKLKFVERQILGKWKWYRQVFLTAIVLCMILVSLVPSIKDAVVGVLQRTGSPLLANQSGIGLLLQDLLLLAFVLTSEVWHWALRVRTYWTARVLSDLEDQYVIRLKAS
jgi:hypothetical protein